jgi:hypothetical protein
MYKALMSKWAGPEMGIRQGLRAAIWLGEYRTVQDRGVNEAIAATG